VNNDLFFTLPFYLAAGMPRFSHNTL